MRSWFEKVPALLSIGAVCWVGLLAVDAAVDNRVQVPVAWLLADAAVGAVAVALVARGGRWVPLGLAVFSEAAAGAAAVALVRGVRRGSTSASLGAAALFAGGGVVRWWWPWIAPATFHRTATGVALVLVCTVALVVWSKYLASEDLRARAALDAAAAAEREWLAREMHDVLAHRLSLVAVHSGALAHREEMDAEERRRLGAVVNQNVRACLGELRGILSDLRGAPPGSAAQAEPPSMGALVAQSDTAAQPIVVQGRLDALEADPELRPHAYRILQEALTNARRHGSEGNIEVSVTQTDASTRLRVVNPARASEPVVPGHGLRGIRERVALCGGEVTCGISGGRFELGVELPARAPEAVST